MLAAVTGTTQAALLFHMECPGTVPFLCPLQLLHRAEVTCDPGVGVALASHRTSMVVILNVPNAVTL